MSSQYSVAVTGLTSFSGMWLAHSFSSHGFRVFGLSHGSLDSYSGLKKRRLELLKMLSPNIKIFENIKAEDGTMSQWIQDFRPNLWLHHFHWMKDFRNSSYDMEAFRKTCMDPLESILASLHQAGVSGVIFSGTYFEPLEASESNPTPYAQSKSLVWNKLRDEALRLGVPLSKVVISSPFGPLENQDRMIPQLVEAAQKGGRFLIQSPHSVADNIPIGELCRAYVGAGNKLLAKSPGKIFRPSGWVGEVKDWVDKVNDEFISKTLGKVPSLVEIGNAGRPRSAFFNPENERVSIDWKRVWADYRKYGTI